MYERYDVARRWCQGQRGLGEIARSLAQLAGQVCLEVEWRDRVAQEEQLHWVAVGTSQVGAGAGSSGMARLGRAGPWGIGFAALPDEG